MKSVKPCTLGALLIRLRRQCKLSQEEVADRVGVRQNTYASWESDKTDVKYTYLLKLADVFGIPVRDLLPAELDQSTTHPYSPSLSMHHEELIALQRCRIQQLEVEIADLRRTVQEGEGFPNL